MKLKDIHNVFFVGIGGIGMSAIARWFSLQGKAVSGYDRVSTPLTESLEKEGITIHYQDNVSLIPGNVLDNKQNSLVVYTPAIPSDHLEYNFFLNEGYEVMKRSQVLGVITKDQYTIGVAGTHGKTTTSSMVAHILHASGFGCNAFIGGIMTNYDSNLILGDKNDVVVVEADEFDRSFLQLHPDVSIVTSVDPDHLDIYGDESEMVRTFNEYVARTDEKGLILLNDRIKDEISETSVKAELLTYSAESGDVQIENLRTDDGAFHFDYLFGNIRIDELKLIVPGFHNMENCIAAITVAVKLGVETEKIKEAVASYRGVKRRFEYLIKTNDFVFIDDYAHHPGEIKAFVSSVRALFPGKKLTAVFQPHLYSRTNDFAAGFAEELSKVDELILLDIYPAREEPIPGVTSEIIFNKLTIVNKTLIEKKDLLETLGNRTVELLVTIGAGDIDRELPALKKLYSGKEVNNA
ncbi:MAG: UDP-N-acetylmuramate--L-alanine ligase, partial [Cyclobacteriaceae bacterium]